MIKKHTFPLLLLLVALIGFAIRLSFFTGNDFPLHDGGFFYVMIQDLLSNDFVIPDHTSYNHANIPFIYPPLGLYFVGITQYITGLILLQLFRIIPLIITTLTIPAIYFLAIELLEDKWAALTAVFVFSLLPMSYKWLILGGGVTRSFGAVFSILALVFVMRFFKSGGWVAAMMASIFCGFTVLSHPEWAWFLFYSIGIFFIIKIFAREKQAWIRAFLIFFGTAIIILPWLLMVYYRHGARIILPLADSGFSRWDDIIKLPLFEWSGEVFFPVFTLLSIVGILRLAQEKKWFVVVWLPLVFIFQGRAAGQRAVLPLALLAGAGMIAVFNFLKSHYPRLTAPKKISAIVVGLFIYSLTNSMTSVVSIAKPLQEQQLRSIEWIEKNTPADSKILVINQKDWVEDNYSEWMAALTGRTSVSLVQGYEWLPGFSDRISRYNHLQFEYSRGMDALVSWINKNDIQTDFLVLPKGKQATFNNWLLEPALHWRDALVYPGVEKVFENELVLILDLRKTIDYSP